MTTTQPPEMSHFRLGRFVVNRFGYGAMRLAGPGVFGPPSDPPEAIAVLRSGVESGANHIDTAQYYGPNVVNDLIRQALYPYGPDLALVNKVGARRDGAGRFFLYNKPDELRRGIEENLSSLQVEQLAAVTLRLVDGAPVDTFFDEQLRAMIRARDDGLLAGIGLSNITVQHLRRALEITDVVCVQRTFSIRQTYRPCRYCANALPETSRLCPFSLSGPAAAGTMRCLATRE